MKTKAIWFAVVIWLGIVCCSTASAARKPRPESLHGIWAVVGVSCTSGIPVSRRAAQLFSSLAIDFQGGQIAKILGVDLCKIISLSPYRVSGKHILFGVGRSDIICRGLPIQKINVAASREWFSLQHGELQIREPALSAICRSQKGTVVYTFRKLTVM